VEFVDVHLLRVDLEKIAPMAAHDGRFGWENRSQQAPDDGHVGVQGSLGRPWWRASPHPVDQCLQMHELSCVHGEGGEHQTALRWTNVQFAADGGDPY
jgi:hypothetical protein